MHRTVSIQSRHESLSKMWQNWNYSCSNKKKKNYRTHRHFDASQKTQDSFEYRAYLFEETNVMHTYRIYIHFLNSTQVCALSKITGAWSFRKITDHGSDPIVRMYVCLWPHAKIAHQNKPRACHCNFWWVKMISRKRSVSVTYLAAAIAHGIVPVNFNWLFTTRFPSALTIATQRVHSD